VASAFVLGRGFVPLDREQIRACADGGIQSFRYDYPVGVEQDAVIEKIEELNEDPAVHGILVQLPSPASFNMARILRTISVDMDVDSFTSTRSEDLSRLRSARTNSERVKLSTIAAGIRQARRPA
jgi:5,10-methylene-tetrahydrofolate dehydrogenase/methenyl tetrahydrofolate cyclohydrolase